MKQARKGKVREESAERRPVPSLGSTERGRTASSGHPEEARGEKERTGGLRGGGQVYTDGEPGSQNGNSGQDRGVAHFFKTFARSVVRGAFCVCGRNIAPLVEGKRCLVIAPHPDDEVVGCGALIMRMREARQPVRIVFVTSGRHSNRSGVMTPDDLAACREAEAVKACAQLGVDAQNVVFLRHPDGCVTGQMDKIAADLQSQIAGFRPGSLFSPFGMDSHADHRSIAIVVDRLARAGTVSCPIYEYPVWFWSFGVWRGALFSFLRKGDTRSFDVRSLLRPRTAAAAPYRDRKLVALAQHRSQVTNLTGEPGWQILAPSFLRHFFGAFELFFEKTIPDRT